MASGYVVHCTLYTRMGLMHYISMSAASIISNRNLINLSRPPFTANTPSRDHAKLQTPNYTSIKSYETGQDYIVQI